MDTGACDGLLDELVDDLLMEDLLQSAAEDNETAEVPRRRPGRPTTLFDPHKGAAEVSVVLEGPEQYCYTVTRLERPVLLALIEALVDKQLLKVDGNRVPVNEKVIIFLDYCANRCSFRQLRRTYQHSFKTFTRIIKDVSKALYLLGLKTIQLPSSIVPWQIEDSSKFWPYFKDYVGAIDGSHVPCRPLRVNPSYWRNRKGFYSQNVLAACDFDLRFIHVLAGFEGSANDSTVLRKAQSHGLQLPRGKYLLADGGYSKNNCMLLVPYQRTRYHLREFAASDRGPQTKEELFNLRHAQLRNCVERLFGAFKLRWSIVALGPQQGFSMRSQKRIIYALAALHNFAKDYGQSMEDDGPSMLPSDAPDSADNLAAEDEDAGMASDHARFRNTLARAMWEDYQALLRVRQGRCVA